jgi:predicted nicotinamide N-methyase
METGEFRQYLDELIPGCEFVKLVRESFLGWPSLAAQDALAEIILQREVLPYQYQRYLLKNLVPDDELSDNLAFALLESSDSKLTQDQDEGFVIYDLRQKSCRWSVICKILRSHSQVGCRIWEAGVYLGELGVELSVGTHHDHQSYFENKVVLELGAGVGQTGILIASSCRPPKSVILTDSPPDVMENLEYNVKRANDAQMQWLEIEKGKNTQDTRNKNMNICTIETATLDWATCTALQCSAFRPDIIIAADVLYDPDLIPPFVETLLLLLRCNAERTNPYALIAHTPRNETTFEVFTSTIAQMTEVAYEDVTHWATTVLPHPSFYLSKKSDLKVLKIELRL